jgi:hypothetical protein
MLRKTTETLLKGPDNKIWKFGNNLNVLKVDKY